MSLKDCLRRSQEAGEITKDDYLELSKQYDRIARIALSPADAKAKLIEELEASKLEKKRRALLTETRRGILETAVFGHRNARGQLDPVQGLQKLIDSFGYSKFDDITNRQLVLTAEVHAEINKILHTFRKGAVSGDLRRKMPQQKMRLDNFVKELFGEDTGDEAARDMARMWHEVSEILRQQFNAAGGSIGKLEKWGLPQHHDQAALIAIGRDAWVQEIFPLLDRDAMKHPLTGRKMTDEELRESLAFIWENVTTNGWLDKEPSGNAGRGAMFRRHADHRFLIFKDADSWLKYQKKFGEADPFAAMMGHVNTMTRDIAAMQILGPNPDAMFRYLKQMVEKRAAMKETGDRIRAEQMAKLREATNTLDRGTQESIAEMQDRIDKIVADLDKARRANGKPKKGAKTEAELLAEFNALSDRLAKAILGERPPTIDLVAKKLEVQDALDELRLPVEFATPIVRGVRGYATAGTYRAENMWLLYKGTTNTPVSVFGANVMNSLRQGVSATALGSAILSSVSDFVTDGFARAMTGLPASRTLHGMLQHMGPNARREAVRSRLNLDSAQNVMGSQGRYVKSVQALKLTSFLADRNIALQGLSMWTQSRKHAFGRDFQGVWADNVGNAFHELDAVYQRTLDRHGITPEDWDVIRTARIDEPKPGATYLRPNEIAELDVDLARRYHAMIFREMRFGTVEGALKARAGGIGGVGRTQPGTFWGEAARSGAQFRGFAATLVMLQAERIAHLVYERGLARGAGYATLFLLTSTLMGAFALQLKNLAAGRDLQDMDDPETMKEFWMAALVQSGGLGIYGDFFTGATNRFGGGLPGTLMGPLAGRVENLWNMTGGNAVQFAGGEPTNAGRELSQFVRQNTPIASSLWWVKLAHQRILADQLQIALDPEAYAAFRRQMRRRETQFGNGFWWEPGKTAPSRAPRLN